MHPFINRYEGVLGHYTILNYSLAGRCIYVGATIGRPSAICQINGKPMVSPTNIQLNSYNNYELDKHQFNEKSHPKVAFKII